MDFMPEGPSIVILKEEANRFLGKTIVRVEGNTTIAKERLLGQRIEAIRSWGKHFLIELDDFSLKVHFLLFGSYRTKRASAPSWNRESTGTAQDAPHPARPRRPR